MEGPHGTVAADGSKGAESGEHRRDFHHHGHPRSAADGTRGSVKRRLLLAMVLTSAICSAEAVGGLWTGSLALLSDAAHLFLGVVALAMSYVALRLGALPPNPRHLYGYRRAELLAALANAITLLVIAVGIGREARNPLLGR